MEGFKDKIFLIASEKAFEERAMQLFKWQAKENTVYKEYLSYLNVNSDGIKSTREIPFLPIQFFKSHRIQTGSGEPQLLFTSSGTTGSATSSHYVQDADIYVSSFREGFEKEYGAIRDYCTLALLPSYLERKGSSLIYMIDHFIESSKYAESGFYLYDHYALYQQLLALKQNKTHTLLIGVSFALLDFVTAFQLDWPELIVMETGGMKGRKKEMTRRELHNALKPGFGVDQIHSEYGMTELLSQAYSKGYGIFQAPPWMKVRVRDTTDPFNYLPHQKTGGLNIIDLANIHSCGFIATDDLGKSYNNNTFEVLGRFDHSDVRGCNLML